MFNLFKKKPAGTKVIDKVVMSEKAKLAALLDHWNNDKHTTFVFWFDESFRQAEAYFASHTTEPVALLTAREAASPQYTNLTPVFAEHYPLRSKEEELFARMSLPSVQVYSSLAEPLFQKFGGDRIIDLMQKLGMKEEEVIEHKMISNAIRNAQDKIGKKINYEQSAHSQEDWFKKNLPS